MQNLIHPCQSLLLNGAHREARGLLLVLAGSFVTYVLLDGVFPAFGKLRAPVLLPVTVEFAEAGELLFPPSLLYFLQLL